MTIKTSEEDVLACLSDIPQSQSDISKKLGIHRSNVTGWLKKLEVKGLAKMTSNGQWVRAGTQQQQHNTTRLSPAQIEVAERMFLVPDEDLNRLDGDYLNGDDEMVFRFINNLSEIFPQNEFLENLFQLAIFKVCGYTYEDAHQLDAVLTYLKKSITDE